MKTAEPAAAAPVKSGPAAPAKSALRRPRSLRGSLTLVNVALLALGLLLAMAASLVGVWTILIGQLDDTLRQDVQDVRDSAPASSPAPASPAPASPDPCAAVPSAVLHRSAPYALLDSRGRVVRSCVRESDGPRRDADALAASVSPVALADRGEGASVRLDGEVYRVGAQRVTGGGILLSTTPMAGMMATVKKLFLLELLVSAALLSLLALLTQRAARRRLRPLEDMVQTASAIAAGHLGSRIPTAGGSSEVTELRTALNSMLQQVETAFRCREEASEQVKRFAADASHELRTPLATIRGYAQLFDKGMLGPEEQERAIGRIASEADRMNRLVEELLALARLEQQPQPQRRPVDLALLAREAAVDLLAVQPGRPVTEAGALKLEDERVPVLGDEGLLRRLVANLLSNVSVHTPPEAPVTVEVTREDEAVLLRVRDDGPGMRPEDAARIFDRFFRADPDRARRTGGSGLGMSIVQAVVQAHDGTLRVETGLGEGMTVEVRFPDARLTA
ncbi:two-component system OmpR family sensor kinase [Streptomyces sp. PvR006]|uniref:sensor histidine kinase n=1 Tax=Streptomyces sp. PvR006 TaxID=2817860 RepID=UPI0027DD7ACE|nr:HAMP domain-containing sensor histidine kinase [Streptomyces sp. PvR006]MBP2585787.1 two-component system OmpR family sensor kinase [Streptomyces sp. PvR006]